MWDNYKPTKAERAAIENAWQVVYRLTGHDWRTEDMTRQEAKGYGNRHDRIGLNGAKALAVKWFYNGTQQPDLKLADYYFCRPAAIWFTGYGASKAYAISVEDENTLKAGLTADENAFKRMQDENRIAA
jgi:hypothetical protein